MDHWDQWSWNRWVHKSWVDCQSEFRLQRSTKLSAEICHSQDEIDPAGRKWVTKFVILDSPGLTQTTLGGTQRSTQSKSSFRSYSCHFGNNPCSSIFCPIPAPAPTLLRHPLTRPGQCLSRFRWGRCVLETLELWKSVNWWSGGVATLGGRGFQWRRSAQNYRVQCRVKQVDRRKLTRIRDSMMIGGIW